MLILYPHYKNLNNAEKNNSLIKFNKTPIKLLTKHTDYTIQKRAFLSLGEHHYKYIFIYWTLKIFSYIEV